MNSLFSWKTTYILAGIGLLVYSLLKGYELIAIGATTLRFIALVCGSSASIIFLYIGYKK